MQNRRDFVKSGLAIVGASMLGPMTAKSNESVGDENLSIGSPVASDVYNFLTRLYVPQVFDNSSSQGYRAYKSQTIKGLMYIVWLDNGSFRIEFDSLKNHNFKVGGVNVTYEAQEMKDVVYSRYVYIGSNMTDKFTIPCLGFFAQFEPSYAIGEADEDNSFSLMFAGRGSSAYKSDIDARVATRLTGYVSGMQGCGCAAYGHKSPTRNACPSGPSEVVNDVVPSYGIWRAVWSDRVIA